MGTFSKSIGGEGGYVAGETRLINYLRNVARGFIFSTSLSPVTMAANLAGIEVLEEEISRVTKLQVKTDAPEKIFLYTTWEIWYQCKI